MCGLDGLGEKMDKFWELELEAHKIAESALCYKMIYNVVQLHSVWADP